MTVKKLGISVPRLGQSLFLAAAICGVRDRFKRIELVPAAVTPEPASLGFSFTGLAIGAVALIRKRFSS